VPVASDPRSPEENLKSFPNPYDCGSAGSARKSLEKKEPDHCPSQASCCCRRPPPRPSLHLAGPADVRLEVLTDGQHRGALAYFRENNPRESMVALGQKIEADLGRKGRSGRSVESISSSLFVALTMNKFFVRSPAPPPLPLPLSTHLRDPPTHRRTRHTTPQPSNASRTFASNSRTHILALRRLAINQVEISESSLSIH
ncbi:hypothetical protein B0H11DRAFT_2083081, partial [Mycena galericulata]